MRFFGMLLKAWAIAKTRRELYALNDHMLRDLGLRREQISSGFLERVVLAEPRLAEVRSVGLVAEADGRGQVAAP